MEDKNRVQDTELEKVAGGYGYPPVSRYKVGDKVTLAVYPEYGIGTVVSVYTDATGFKCMVKFDAGIMDASEYEFNPA